MYKKLKVLIILVSGEEKEFKIEKGSDFSQIEKFINPRQDDKIKEIYVDDYEECDHGFPQEFMGVKVQCDAYGYID